MLDRIEFLLSEALVALRRNTWMTFAAISTCCMALFLTGGVGFAYKGVSEYAEKLPTKFEIRVFLKDGISKESSQNAASQIRKMTFVQTATLIPKEQAWEKFKKENPSFPSKGLSNPLPDSINVTMTNVDSADELSKKIAAIPQVAPGGVRYAKQEREMLSQAHGLLRVIGLTLGGLMLITSGVLIFNAIRAAILTRQREFRIMELVGAAPSTVTTPLMIEGIIQGAVGGFLASLLVSGSHWYLRWKLSEFKFISLGNLSFGVVCLVLSLLGAAYGLLCSLAAIRDMRKAE